jgi:uncharacterized protein YbjT (DUF2867 family)
MNLVVGASGLLGSEICRRLAGEGKQITALVRGSTDLSKQDKLRSLGARLVYADLKDPSTLGTACIGISTVISTESSTLARRETRSRALPLEASSISFARRSPRA